MRGDPVDVAGVYLDQMTFSAVSALSRGHREAAIAVGFGREGTLSKDRTLTSFSCGVGKSFFNKSSIKSVVTVKDTAEERGRPLLFPISSSLPLLQPCGIQTISCSVNVYKFDAH